MYVRYHPPVQLFESVKSASKSARTPTRRTANRAMTDSPVVSDSSVDDLRVITGQSRDEASRLLDAAGSVEAAVSLFFDGDATAEPPSGVEAAPLPSEEASAAVTATASSHTSTETSAAPRVLATAWQPADTGDNFRRRLLLGPAADRQLREDEHRPHHLVEWKSQPGAGGQWQVELSIHNQTAGPLEVLWVDWQAGRTWHGAVHGVLHGVLHGCMAAWLHGCMAAAHDA